MRRIIALSSLMALAIGAPSTTEAQTEAMAPPVPGPYQAAPKPQGRPNPYGKAAKAQPLPYWMRPQPGQAAANRSGTAAPQSFIPGWTWTPYAPGRGSAMSNGPRPTGQYGQYGQNAQGYRPGSPQPGYTTRPWTPPGYAPGGWPNPQFRAPQYYGASPQPNQ
jgi:hypothetical protein